MVNHNKMGLLGAISYIIGSIIGSGIFITPTSIIENTNSVGLSLSIWIVSAIISMYVIRLVANRLNKLTETLNALLNVST
uniref:Amino acid permease n=1 Tax=Acrobeloides nanus TaxID=290746 RepID=A0A914ECU2_9BILA